MNITIELIHQSYRAVNIYSGPNDLFLFPFRRVGVEGTMLPVFPLLLGLPWGDAAQKDLQLHCRCFLGFRKYKHEADIFFKLPFIKQQVIKFENNYQLRIRYLGLALHI